MDATQVLDFDDVDMPVDEKKEIGRLTTSKHKNFPETEFIVYDGANIIGRDIQSDIVITVQSLSKKHACIEHSSGECVIFDLNSRNKTRKGKMILKPCTHYALTDGDLLIFGDVHCKFELLENMDKDKTESLSGSGAESESMMNEDDKKVEDENIGKISSSKSEKGRSTTPSPSLLDREQQPSSDLASSDIILPTQNYIDQKIDENENSPDSFKQEIENLRVGEPPAEAYAAETDNDSDSDDQHDKQKNVSLTEVVKQTPVLRSTSKAGQQQNQDEIPQSETSKKLEFFLDDSIGTTSHQKDRLSCSFNEEVQNDSHYADTIPMEPLKECSKENASHFTTDSENSSINIKKALQKIEEQHADTVLLEKGTDDADLGADIPDDILELDAAELEAGNKKQEEKGEEEEEEGCFGTYVFNTDGFHYDGDKDDTDTDDDDGDDDDDHDDETENDNLDEEISADNKVQHCFNIEKMRQEEKNGTGEIVKEPFDDSQPIAFQKNSTQITESLVSFGTPTSSINDSRKEVLSSAEPDRKNHELNKTTVSDSDEEATQRYTMASPSKPAPKSNVFNVPLPPKRSIDKTLPGGSLNMNNVNQVKYSDDVQSKSVTTAAVENLVETQDYNAATQCYTNVSEPCGSANDKVDVVETQDYNAATQCYTNINGNDEHTKSHTIDESNEGHSDNDIGDSSADIETQCYDINTTQSTQAYGLTSGSAMETTQAYGLTSGSAMEATQAYGLGGDFPGRDEDDNDQRFAIKQIPANKENVTNLDKKGSDKSVTISIQHSIGELHDEWKGDENLTPMLTASQPKHTIKMPQRNCTQRKSIRNQTRKTRGATRNDEIITKESNPPEHITAGDESVKPKQSRKKRNASHIADVITNESNPPERITAGDESVKPKQSRKKRNASHIADVITNESNPPERIETADESVKPKQTRRKRGASHIADVITNESNPPERIETADESVKPKQTRKKRGASHIADVITNESNPPERIETADESVKPKQTRKKRGASHIADVITNESNPPERIETVDESVKPKQSRKKRGASHIADVITNESNPPERIKTADESVKPKQTRKKRGASHIADVITNESNPPERIESADESVKPKQTRRKRGASHIADTITNESNPPERIETADESVKPKQTRKKRGASHIADVITNESNPPERIETADESVKPKQTRKKRGASHIADVITNESNLPERMETVDESVKPKQTRKKLGAGRKSVRQLKGNITKDNNNNNSIELLDSKGIISSVNEEGPDKQTENTVNVKTDVDTPSKTTLHKAIIRKKKQHANNKNVTNIKIDKIISSLNSSEGSPNKSRRVSTLVKPRIIFTGFNDTSVIKVVEDLGGSVVDSVDKASHLVTDKVRRTVKFMCAVARGIPIVLPAWLKNCKTSGMFIDHKLHILRDTAAEKQYKFTLRTALTKASGKRLLEGYQVHVTQNVKPEPQCMKEMIECSGGKYVSKVTKNSSKETTLVISCADDDYSKLSGQGYSVYSNELLLTGILRQDLQFNQFNLSKVSHETRKSEANKITVSPAQTPMTKRRKR